VAQAVLLQRIELGRGEAALFGLEPGVVAESVRPAGRSRDMAVPGAIHHDGCGIVRARYHHQHAVVVRRPVGAGGQRRYQLRVVARVARLSITIAAGVVGRMHARGAPQGGHAQPRIIGEGGKTRGAARVARLGEGVLQERVVGFLGFTHAQLALRHCLDAQRRQQRLQLAQLAGVIGRDDELVHSGIGEAAKAAPTFSQIRTDS
jgi:hypothetical protein